MLEESNKNRLWIVIVVLAALALGGVIYFYFKKPVEGPKPEAKNITETAKDVGEAVPQISTNPGESVPEVNPIDRANPFKYNNPLR